MTFRQNNKTRQQISTRYLMDSFACHKNAEKGDISFRSNIILDFKCVGLLARVKSVRSEVSEEIVPTHHP